MYEAIVIGVSAGGLSILTEILGVLPADFKIPIFIVQHRSRDERSLLEEVIQVKCKIKIFQADEKFRPKAGAVYFAPPDYHLLIESDRSFSLSYDPPVNYSRPSIDVLFETAAEVYRTKLIGIILTGANHDGAKGISKIRQLGGVTIAQKPETAQYPYMPKAAIDTNDVQYILTPTEIIDFLLSKNQAIYYHEK